MDAAEALDRVRTDPELRATLRTCRQWGVSLRRFLGVEPAQRLIRDDLGRVVRVELEPDWDLESRQLAVALTVYEADTCSGCGGQLSETTDPDRDGRYVATLPVRCFACTAIDERAEAYAETRTPRALRFGTQYHPPVTDAALAEFVDGVVPSERA